MAEDLIPSPTPLTPPHHEEDWLAWIRLLRSHRVGPTTFRRLLREHGSPDAALKVLPAIARAAGLRTYRPCSERQAREELRAGRRAGARPISIADPLYPAALAEMADAPPLLWARGTPGLLQRPLLALVGARNASSLGIRMARRLAAELAEAGFVVVSGLARGIDTAAHLGALDGGTIALMAGGIDVFYPAENAALGEDIGRRGLLLSEQPPGLRPIARHFPQRNRIIAGLCRGIVVIEAAARSGSLITARMALDLGREVMAVPGHPFDGRAGGCNMLIRDGATLVRNATDVLAALGEPADRRQAPPRQQPPPRQTGPASSRRSDGGTPATAEPGTGATPPPVGRSTTGPGSAAAGSAPPSGPDPQKTRRLHSEILSRLGPSPLSEDQLIRDLRTTAAKLAPALLGLELDGKITRQPGGLLSRAG